jgi:hypothetical protein
VQTRILGEGVCFWVGCFMGVYLGT